MSNGDSSITAQSTYLCRASAAVTSPVC